jgi:hypothetical protein
MHGSSVEARDGAVGLRVEPLNFEVQPRLESQPISRDYGAMQDAVSACWRIFGRPGKLSWKISLSH